MMDTLYHMHQNKIQILSQTNEEIIMMQHNSGNWIHFLSQTRGDFPLQINSTETGNVLNLKLFVCQICKK